MLNVVLAAALDVAAMHPEISWSVMHPIAVETITRIFLEEHRRLGKRLIFRSFGSIKSDYEDLIAGANACAADYDFEIETKITPFDFSPFLPANPYLGKTSRCTIGAECDCLGEYLGETVLGEWAARRWPKCADEMKELAKKSFALVEATQFIDHNVCFHQNPPTPSFKFIKFSGILGVFRDGMDLHMTEPMWGMMSAQKTPGRAAIRAECAARAKLRARKDVVDFVVPGGIYDDVRVRRVMHSSYQTIDGGVPVRFVGNAAFPNGTIAVEFKDVEGACVEVDADPKYAKEFTLVEKSANGVRSVTIAKKGASYPGIRSIALVKRDAGQ